MNMLETIAMRKVMILLTITLSICLLLLSLLYSSTMHARLNLLVAGYPFCQLVDPPTSYPDPVASKLVISHRVCVGHLERFGEFVSASDPDPSNGFYRDFRLTAVLFYMLLTFGASSLMLAAYLFWQALKPRSAT
jgi:hypothetical protein